jgi:hypothetical protein
LVERTDARGYRSVSDHGQDVLPGPEANSWTGLLPSGLEHLRLRDDLSDHSEYPYKQLDALQLLKQLVEARLQQYTCLRRVALLCIRRPLGCREGQPAIHAVETLRRVCGRAGLECEIVKEVGASRDWDSETVEVRINDGDVWQELR